MGKDLWKTDFCNIWGMGTDLKKGKGWYIRYTFFIIFPGRQTSVVWEMRLQFWSILHILPLRQTADSFYNISTTVIDISVFCIQNQPRTVSSLSKAICLPGYTNTCGQCMSGHHIYNASTIVFYGRFLKGYPQKWKCSHNLLNLPRCIWLLSLCVTQTETFIQINNRWVSK